MFISQVHSEAFSSGAVLFPSPGGFLCSVSNCDLGCVRTTAQTPGELRSLHICIGVGWPELETKLQEPTDFLLNPVLP